MNATARAVLLIAATILAVAAALCGYDGRVRWHRVALALAVFCIVLTWAWDAAVVAW
jgi:hypothetical protein